MNTTYSPAREVEILAADIISEHHSHLMGIPIVYVFVSPTPTNKAKEEWGRARKVSGLNAHLIGHFADTDRFSPKLIRNGVFVIEIALFIWGVSGPRQRMALVDHQLSHCWVEVDDKTVSPILSILPHDVEEFAPIVSRYGLWRGDIKDFIAAVNDSHQLQLFSTEDELEEDTKVTIAWDGQEVETTTGEISKLGWAGVGSR